MEDEKPEVDEEQGEEIEEVDEDISTDEEPEDDGKDDEFEYDADGNIIIPDVIDDEPEEDEDGGEGTEDDTEASGESKAEPAKADEKPEEKAEPKPDAKDTEIAALRKELAALKKQGKETLTKLGVKSDDVMEGLEKVAAESEEVSLEDYRKNKAEQAKTEQAKQLIQRTTFEQQMKSDLEEVQKFYPETKGKKSVTEIDNFREFARLRDKGLSPKQAYAAANPDGIRTRAATSAKQQSLNDTKAHLKSVVPKGSKDNSVTMPRKELAEWRDIFPNLSDKEIVSLYKQSLE